MGGPSRLPNNLPAARGQPQQWTDKKLREEAVGGRAGNLAVDPTDRPL